MKTTEIGSSTELSLSPKTKLIKRLKTSQWKPEELSATGRKNLKMTKKRLCCSKNIQKLCFDFYLFWLQPICYLSQARLTLKGTNHLQVYFKGSGPSKIVRAGIQKACSGFFLKSFSPNFEQCPERITDEEFQSFLKYLKRLVFLQDFSLSLKKSDITEIGICGMGKALKRLTSLENISFNFQSCRITKREIEHPFESTKKLYSLQKFSLNIWNCAPIQENDLEGLKKNYPLLVLFKLA